MASRSALSGEERRPVDPKDGKREGQIHNYDRNVDTIGDPKSTADTIRETQRRRMPDPNNLPQ